MKRKNHIKKTSNSHNSTIEKDRAQTPVNRKESSRKSQQRIKKSPSQRKKKPFNTPQIHPPSLPPHPKISIIMTSYKEPALHLAIEAVIHQHTMHRYELIIVSPEKEAEDLVARYKNSHLHYFKDEGKGKVAAINQVLQTIASDIVILTDGDVIVLPNAINELVKPFEDPHIGCVSGRVISANQKDAIFGYWSHLLADAGAHQIRKELAEKKQFLECTGYLFAFRSHGIKKIPTDVAEDTIIPYLFKQKGYGIGYAEKAEVLVKNPTNWGDWLQQRKRTAKSHETLKKYVDIQKIPRVKSFTNEIQRGFFWALSYPQTVREFYWTLLLFLARFYMWLLVFYETRILDKHYTDKWKRVETAR